MDTTLVYILLFTFISGVLSLAGGLILLWKRSFAENFTLHFISFAAGVLLGTAFLDLLPEALEEAGEADIFLPLLSGILVFFIVERFILWYHHHHEGHYETVKPTTTLITVGDTLHNFIDGVAITATFLVSTPLGILTALAVAAHELPQEIGDFAIMIKNKVTTKKIILFNLLASMGSIVGAVATYLAAGALEPYHYMLIAFTAGMFTYIACSDLIPELHGTSSKDKNWHQAGLLILGVVIVYIFRSYLDLGH